MSSSLPLQEPPRRVQVVDVTHEFFGYGLLFGGTVRVAVGGVGAGGDEGTEAFVSGMGGDVDASSAEDVVIGDDDGRGDVLGCVAAHDDGLVRINEECSW